MFRENQIVLKNSGWEVKVFDVKGYVEAEGSHKETLEGLQLSDLIDTLQKNSYANTDLVVIDIGDMRKLVELILVNSVKVLKTKDGITPQAA
jgi:hypothetical protein